MYVAHHHPSKGVIYRYIYPL